MIEDVDYAPWNEEPCWENLEESEEFNELINDEKYYESRNRS